MSQGCSIQLTSLFSGTIAHDVMHVTISGTFSSLGAPCSDLQVSLSCPKSKSSGPATLDSQTGAWTARLATDCDCGTDLVMVVAGSPGLGCSISSIGQIVCSVDNPQQRTFLDQVMNHRRWLISHRQFLAAENFGTCYKCIAISMALFALSLLVLSMGAITHLAVVTVIGLLAAIAFGSLVGLHGIFFFLKRKKSVIQQPRQQRSCCGS